MIAESLRKIPVIGHALAKLYGKVRGIPTFTTSGDYWEQRYKSGGHSGAGSYNKFAEYKGEVINDFVTKNHVDSVIEFGCGDGNQLKYFQFSHYLGFDVSESVISLCRELFSADVSKQFKLMDDYSGEKAELTLSLDVIYHLTEEEVYMEYMQRLFSASNNHVIVYSSNDEEKEKRTADHLKLRKFTDWVEEHKQEFKLIEHIPNKYPFDGDGLNTSISDFYIFQKLKPGS